MAGSYKLEYLETNPVTDITEYVHTIDDVALFSDGRISYAKITLQSSFGQFMTDARGGLTPLVDEFERFKFTFTDSDGQVKTKIMELMTDLSQLTLTGEYLLPLEFQGRERHLAFIPFSGVYDFTNHYVMAEQVLVSYHYDRGTKQPTFLTNDGATETNELPKFNPNMWDFQYIDNCLDALKEIIKHANNPVSAGGAGDRYTLIFDDDPLDPPTTSTPGNIILRIIPQGSRNSAITPKPIIVNSKAVPIKKVDKIKQPKTGTIVIARGRAGTGRTPTASDLYIGRLEFWRGIDDYVSTVQYKLGSYVRYGELTYQCILTPPGVGTLPTNATYWDSITIGEYIGNFNYSPLTNGKATLYRNNGGNPGVAFSSLDPLSPKVCDCNIVITNSTGDVDNNSNRDWVLFRSKTSVVADLTADMKKYLWNEASFYEGFRMLLDPSVGTLAGIFAAGTDSYGMGAGKDPRGIPFINNCVILAEDGKWYVFGVPDSANPDSVKTTPEYYQQVVVIYEGTIYEWNVNFTAIRSAAVNNRRTANTDRKRSDGAGTPSLWKNIAEEFLSNDCWHSPTIIENVTGLTTPRIKSTVPTVYYTDNSAVRIVYGHDGTDTDIPAWKNYLDRIIGFVLTTTAGFAGLLVGFGASALLLYTTPRYQNCGWWWTISHPFPLSTFNGIGEKVGELLGGQTLEELNTNPFFDCYNQKNNPAGNKGWSNLDSKEMMEIVGATFNFRLYMKKDGVDIPFTGDIPVSYWAIDNNGTIWKSKSVYRFLGDIQRFTFQFGDFTPVYRARTPFGIKNIIQNIIVPELEIRERLFPNRIKWQGFMLEAPYDEHGRYMPNAWDLIIKPTLASVSTSAVVFDGVIDDFAWIKTPIAISASDAETVKRRIFPEIKDFPNITNLEQLQRTADAELDIEEFRYEQYTILQNDKLDQNLQDTVYLQEDNIISEEDKAGTPHTREVVIGEYHIAVNNEHDLKRTLVLIKRIPVI